MLQRTLQVSVRILWQQPRRRFDLLCLRLRAPPDQRSHMYTSLETLVICTVLIHKLTVLSKTSSSDQLRIVLVPIRDGEPRSQIQQLLIRRILLLPPPPTSQRLRREPLIRKMLLLQPPSFRHHQREILIRRRFLLSCLHRRVIILLLLPSKLLTDRHIHKHLQCPPRQTILLAGDPKPRARGRILLRSIHTCKRSTTGLHLSTRVLTDLVVAS